MLTVDRIDKIEDFMTLRPEWNRLVERYAGADLFFTHEWLAMNWEYFCREKSPKILLVRDRKKLVGVIPLSVERISRFGLTVRKITFLHGGNVYDRGDFLIPDQSGKVLEAVFGYLEDIKSDWDIVQFSGIPQDSFCVPILAKIMQKHGMRASSWRRYNEGLYLPITMPWEDFLRGRSKNFRRSLKRAEEKISEAGKVEIVTIRDPELIKKKVGELYEMQEKNRLADGVPIPESDRVSQRAGLRLAELYSHGGNAEVMMLVLNDQPLAGLFSVSYRNLLYALVIKYDKKYAEMSPGWVLLYHVIRNGWQQGFRGIDFIMKWPYLERWTTLSRTYLRIDCYNGTLSSRGLRYAQEYLLPAAHYPKRLLAGRPYRKRSV